MGDVSSILSDGQKRNVDDIEASELATNPVKAAKTEHDFTAVIESGDPFLEAMHAIYRIGQQAIEAGKNKLDTVDQNYSAGFATGMDTDYIDVATRFRYIATSLEAVANKFAGRVKAATIHKMPVEVILLVFSCLDADSLFACQDTCRRWRKVLKGQDAKRIWRWHPVIRGTVSDIDYRWDELAETYTCLSSLSVKLGLSREDDPAPVHPRLMDSLLVRDFPIKTLKEYRHEGRLNGDDIGLWDLLTMCEKLQVIHWTSFGAPNPKKFRYDLRLYYHVKTDSPLASCRIKDFKFHIDSGSKYPISIDMAFVQMLSQVKFLDLNRGLSLKHIVAILDEARDSLEELTIRQLACAGGWRYTEPDSNWKCPPLVMKNLRKVIFQDARIGVLSITAPQADFVRFDHGKLVDMTLLESCRQSLKSLHMDIKGFSTEPNLGKERFDMPQLEDLELNLSGFTLSALWNAVDSNCEKELHQDILPSLKKLEIINDGRLNQDLILKFIESRQDLNMVPIREMIVHLSKKCSAQVAKLDLLKQTMPGFFRYMRYHEWHAQ